MEKVSDLMERGWDGIPQVRGRFLIQDFTTDTIAGACAVGAVCRGINPRTEIGSMLEAYDTVPDLKQDVSYLDSDDIIRYAPLGIFLVEMNDYLKYDKQRILETLRSRGL
jgi:hypothetical protein